MNMAIVQDGDVVMRRPMRRPVGGVNTAAETRQKPGPVGGGGGGGECHRLIVGPTPQYGGFSTDICAISAHRNLGPAPNHPVTAAPPNAPPSGCPHL